MAQRSKEDPVDKILKQWARERPDLDVTPMGIIGRISRLERLIDEQMKAVCSTFNLERWGFDVLASLRRSGKPYRLTPTQLYNSLMLTSGAIGVPGLLCTSFIERNWSKRSWLWPEERSTHLIRL